MPVCEGGMEWQTQRGDVAKSHGLAWEYAFMILSPEICLPNYGLLSPGLKISGFPQSSSEVKLQRELVEKHVHWNYIFIDNRGRAEKHISLKFFAPDNFLGGEILGQF